MRYLFLIAFLFVASSAWAQNPQCPDRPGGDSTNACANTRFVQRIPIVPVTRYGVICDGAAHTNNDTNLTTAITAARNHSILMFPGGTCIFANINLLTDSITLQGAGPNVTYLKQKSGTGSDFIVIGNNTYQFGSTIQNLTVEGNGAAQAAGDCISVRGAFQVTLQNLVVQNCYANGIKVDATVGEGPFGGLFLTDVAVVNYGVGVTGTAGINIGQYIFGVNLKNVNISGGPAGNAYGILASSSQNSVIIANSDINVGSDYQIYLQSLSFAQVIGTFIHCGGTCKYGLFLDAVNSSVVSGNNFRSLAREAIYIKSTSVKNTICGNTINSSGAPTTPDYAIHEEAGSVNNVYCGANPGAFGNTIDGTYGVARFLINAPIVDAGTVGAESSDWGGSFASGTTVTSTVMTFSSTWISGPDCTFATNNTGVTATPTTKSSTSVTISYTVPSTGAAATVTALPVTYNCTGVK